MYDVWKCNKKELNRALTPLTVKNNQMMQCDISQKG